MFFPLAIMISEDIKFTMAPLYMDSFYVQLDKCAKNIIRPIGLIRRSYASRLQFCTSLHLGEILVDRTKAHSVTRDDMEETLEDGS